MNRKKGRFSRRYIPWIFAVLVVLGAFIMSGQSAQTSHSISRSVSLRLYEAIEPTILWLKTAPRWEIELSVDNAVRKLTHFATYLLLELAVILGLRGFTKNKAAIVLFSCLIVFVMSSADETHQLFSEGRGASVSDVVIDTAGALAALLLAAIHLAAAGIIRWLGHDWSPPLPPDVMEQDTKQSKRTGEE